MNKDYTIFGKKLETETIIAGVLILLSFVLVFAVIVPQFKNIGVQREQNTLKQNEVAQLQSSLAALNSVSLERVASDVKVMNEALPTNKDIITIFSSIVSLTTQTGIQLSGFTLEVGDIYNVKEDKNSDVTDTGSDTSFPALDVVLTLQSVGQEEYVSFTNLLYSKLPLAKINTIEAKAGSSTMEISFYYRPEDLSVLQNTNNIPGYTKESLSTLDTLRKWKEN